MTPVLLTLVDRDGHAWLLPALAGEMRADDGRKADVSIMDHMELRVTDVRVVVDADGGLP